MTLTPSTQRGQREQSEGRGDRRRGQRLPGGEAAGVRARSSGAPGRAAAEAPADERQSRPPAAAHNSSPPSMERAAGRRARLPPPPPAAVLRPGRAASCRFLAWLVPFRLRDGVRLTHGMAERRIHERGFRIAPPPPPPEGRGARLPPLEGWAAGGGRQLSLFIYLCPRKKMDAIKITRGRTRRSQGAGDALGGPSPAAARGPRGRAGRLRAAPAPAAPAAVRGCAGWGGRRGRRVAPGRKRWRGERWNPGGGGGGGSASGKAARECGRAAQPWPAVHAENGSAMLWDAARWAPGGPSATPSRERHRRSAARLRPRGAAAPRSPE